MVSWNKENPAYELARRFGISIVKYDTLTDDDEGDWLEGMEPADYSPGPDCHGLSLAQKTVYDWDAREEDCEKLFHEVVHLIVQPPGFDIEDICEGWLLMQMERSFARALA